tara:strand:+ start:13287 stop:13469 length:183 start_codon:yes stop_codon:yes gene_type:complete
MGNCMSNKNKQSVNNNVNQRNTNRNYEIDDTPYEERTREQRMDSETRQMLRSMQQNHGFS